MKRRAPGLLAALAVVSLLAIARPANCEVTLSLSLDRSEATLVDSVMLSVSVSGARGQAARPAIQGLDDFLVRPAGASTRVQIVNGAYSSGTDFTFVIQPKKAGAFSIGPAQLTVDGTTYSSNVAALAVGQPVASPDGDRGPVFLVASIAPAKVYIEQQAIYTLKLYRSVSIADASVNVPELDGVAIAKHGEPREYQGVHQGRPYQIIEVRYLVTPQRAGNFTLPPTRMDLTVYTPQNRPRRGIFDDPFFGQRASGRPQALMSEALPFPVLPLPLDGRPADFGGLVGGFTLEATLEPRELKAGESATLRATVRGRGNVKRIPELKIPTLDGIKVYADQPVLKSENDGDGVTVTKILTWALVPERAGRYQIPPLALSYFDTASGRYKSLKTTGATLTVAPGRPGDLPAPPRVAGTAAPAQPKREVAELGSDILPVHATIGETASGLAALPGAAVFWLLLIGPVAAFLLTFGGAALRQRSAGITAARSVRRAAGVFARACERSGLTADELMQALQDYLSQRLSLARGSLTADEAAALLRSRSVNERTVGELHGLWRRVEDAIYTGRGGEATTAGAALAALVARIEKELP